MKARTSLCYLLSFTALTGCTYQEHQNYFIPSSITPLRPEEQMIKPFVPVEPASLPEVQDPSPSQDRGPMPRIRKGWYDERLLLPRGIKLIDYEGKLRRC